VGVTVSQQVTINQQAQRCWTAALQLQLHTCLPQLQLRA
jgi:hypothetical protein